MADYKIKKGDNLTKIAKRYGTTVDALVKANNIKNKNLIVTGRTLNIPGQAVKKAAATKTATKATADKGPARSYTKQYMDSKRGSGAKPKRQTVLQKAGINTTAIATALVPTGKAIQGIKTMAGAAKYGKVVSRNLNNMQRGYTRGVVTKKELEQAKKLAEAVAKRKQQLKSGGASPKPKVNTAKTQQMAKEMLDSATTKASGKKIKLAKRSVAATGAAYVSKKLKEQE